MDKSLGVILKELRLKANIDVVELAFRAGCSVPSIYSYENNRMVPSLAILQSLAEVLDADVGDLAKCDLKRDNRRVKMKRENREDITETTSA